MTKRGRRKPVDPASFHKYRRVGMALRRSAEDLAALADDGDAYGNAMGVSAVHACIAYSDALCVRYAGFKSSEGDHLKAVDALREALGHRTDESALKALRRVLGQKHQISYQGEYCTAADARSLVGDMSAFCAWADDLLA